MNEDKAKQLIRAVKNRDTDRLKKVFSWLLNHYQITDALIWALSTTSARLLETDVEWLFSQFENNTYLPQEFKNKVDTALFKHLVAIGCEPGTDFVLTDGEFTLSSEAEHLILSTIAAS